MGDAELDIGKLELQLLNQLEELAARTQSVLGQLRLVRNLRSALPSPQSPSDTPPEDVRT